MKTQQRTSSSHQEGKIKHRAKQNMMACSIRIRFRGKKKKSPGSMYFLSAACLLDWTIHNIMIFFE